ncbi:MAG: hypothetical protein OXQ29_20640 [Rhodospirillaceae bacterium]|nr:hypothetical protein [Rhodospirillaceae bacterium]
MNPSFKLVILLNIAVALCAGCVPQNVLDDRVLRADSQLLNVEFDQIPTAERCAVHASMRVLRETGTNYDDAVAECESQGPPIDMVYPFTLSGNDLQGQFELWHQRISAIRNQSGIPIPTLDGYQLNLRYVSTMAVATGGADIEITVPSNNHELYIDTDLPGIERYRDSEDARVRLTFGNVFQINLPFAFIRENSGIYYRSRLNFAERYFYYNLDTQMSEELNEVDYRERL